MSEKIYKIGEVASLLQLKGYVLRFWETEFPQLEPLRTDKGQRLYTEQHVELLIRIKDLLHEKGMTIEGARRVLEEETIDLHVENDDQKTEKDGVLESVRQELLALRQLLEQPSH